MNKYKQFTKIISTTLICLFLTFLLTIWLQLGARTEQSRWLYEVYQKKNVYAESIDQRKIIIVSGSNSLFGIRAQDMESSLGIPVVNYGTNAALRLDYMLWQAQKIAKTGDVIVMPLEYPKYNEANDKIGEAQIDYYYARDVAYYKALPFTEKIFLAGKTSFKRVAKGLVIKYYYKNQQPSVNEGYQSKNVNAHGDEQSNIVASSSEEHALFMQRFPPDTILTRGIRPDSESWVIIERFAKWCKENGITLVAAYPSLLRDDIYSQPMAIKTFKQIESFYKSIDVPLVGDFQSSFYDEQLMYDSIYHLNSAGQTIRTNQFIQALEPFVKLQTPL